MDRQTLPLLPIAAVLLLGAGVANLAACDKMKEQTEAERRIATEQKAIEAYSEQVPVVDAKLQEFTEVWRKANELADVKALREAFEARVVPALEAYVKALDGMPTGSDELERIHAIVEDAYKGVVADFRAFADGLTEDNLVERHKKLLAAADRVSKAEEKYYAQLREYYAANRVTLLNARGAAAAGGAGDDGDRPDDQVRDGGGG